MLVRPDLVPEPAEGAEEPRRRDDAEEAADVHHGQRAPRVLCAEYAARTDELHRQESGRCAEQQQGDNGKDNLHDDYTSNRNNECLLDLNANERTREFI
jgi:hypothetical protein